MGYTDGVGFIHGKLAIGKAMAPPIIRQVKEYASHEGTVIVDVSPGASCPVVEAAKDTDLCLLVTEPTPSGLNDLSLALEVVRKLGIPCAVVINRDGIGDDKVARYCQEQGVPILPRIPLERG